MTNNRRFVNHIIRNVVQQNSIPDGTMPSPEAQFTLTKYFDDANTVDLVFINMMDRVNSEKTHFEPVLSRILKLIKNNISLHPPSLQILLDLDAFCICSAPLVSATLQKTITYIRALIANQVRQHPSYIIHQQHQLGVGNSGLMPNGSGHGSSMSMRRSSIGLVRTRSQSASTSSTTSRDDQSPLQPRTSLDLSNMLSISNQQPQHNPAMSVSSSTSTSSSPSPQSVADSPIRITLNNSQSSTVSTPLSPNLMSAITNSPGQGDPTAAAIGISASVSGNSIAHITLKDSGATALNNATITHPFSSSNGMASSGSNLINSPTLSRRAACQDDGYICDFIGFKTNIKSSSSIAHKHKIQSLLTHSPFGVLQQCSDIKAKDIFVCPDDSNNMAPINIVQQAKKRSERKDATLTMRRRKAPALFQYKYYKDQEQLKISEAEKLQVIKVINNPSTAQDRAIASRIFIKILLDIYCKNGVEGEKTILAYFKQIIESPSKDTRIQLFNIIFNLAIHVNIYSELKLDDGSHGTIGDLQSSVFSLLRDILNHCVEHERDNKVWQEALNCMIFFVVHQGAIIRNRMFQLNSGIISCMLTYVQDISDQTKRMLVRMLCNFLYRDVNHSNQQNSASMALNEEELNAVGGIDFVLRLYTSVRSNEAKNNLFVVVFDYVLQSALKCQIIADTQLVQEAPLLLELFKRADAPHYFVQLFKCIPEKDFVSDFFQFASSDASKNNEASFSYEDLIIKFSMKIHEHAVRFQKMDPYYEKFAQEVQDHPDKSAALLQEWLFNEQDETIRMNGANWLLVLLKKTIIDKEPINYAFNIFVQLASHANPQIRRLYISLTERLLLLSKYRLKTGESKRDEIFELFNECMQRLIAAGEKDESNLLLIIDIMFDLIYTRNGAKTLFIKDTQPDTNYSLFLNNQFVISISLLKLINIGTLHYSFANIPTLERYYEPRLMLLHLLLLRCSDAEDLAKIGGIGFFKNLMHDSCTQIAYHSSYFLLTQLEAESPEQYRSILTRLLSKARENNDENLISNPFFQVQGIIDMTHK
ncbi:hypothetical protein SAMD00019534_044760 [Acytostelium subglobosum LB1]|uniref:hypothetical protein n=1 Tax=Acytostelium subglobosum LB1 TaxID=1410327 RepID=UPI0006448A7B|nr:hypothetical protein SAMD00019534_044760 [Acytostelium subglobosum LB1]GAM21301.1 hypothetical protein SAMD00019534_044760 [Acytostelium subglobosum LB1]|eukprot:XP_012755420.1 hypothetical protein SAMD00019534_044760 [Acytostelium subglobosum LB1]